MSPPSMTRCPAGSHLIGSSSNVDIGWRIEACTCVDCSPAGDLDFTRFGSLDLVGEEDSLLWFRQIGAFEDEASKGIFDQPSDTVVMPFFGLQTFPKEDFSFAVQLLSLCPNL